MNYDYKTILLIESKNAELDSLKSDLETFGHTVVTTLEFTNEEVECVLVSSNVSNEKIKKLVNFSKHKVLLIIKKETNEDKIQELLTLELNEFVYEKDPFFLINHRIQHAQDTLELSENTSELNEFVAIVSHDLKQPLRKIGFLAERIQHSTFLDDEPFQFLTEIKGTVLRMQSIINDILTYSRSSAKKNPFSKINLESIIADIRVNLEKLLVDKHGEITCEKMPTFDGDPSLIHVVFQNLISNSLKYSKKGVKPIITITGQENNDETIEISVKDNGIGFDMSKLPLMFAPFKRLKTIETVEGSGIGLATVKKIINFHNGTISASSKEGEGATFIIRIAKKEAISK
jgi:signal transduction histidine kinase